MMEATELRQVAENILCYFDHKAAADLLLKAAEHFENNPPPEVEDVTVLGED